MAADARGVRSAGPPVGMALLLGAAAVGVALTAHGATGRWAPLAGLLLAAGALACGVARSDRPRALLGLRRPTARVRVATVGALLVGGGLGVVYRWYYGATPLPAGLTWFVLPAVAIGAAEEIAYRGFVLGAFRDRPRLAVAVAAGLHTAYKAALFLFPPADATVQPVDILVLAAWTFGAGLAFGAARLRWSLAVPLALHVAFDIVVYGGRATVPWWVW